eukprot:gnl/TRDRNA2_/TRDRNA2_147219_c1_seq2.p1 gnl/TRDRNA2_/TRDRNA2_147219_c1~~gnl/TRDRNA2_/TRDRNA2_147219_c1_seq2.p1  ORF type:complete len:331 (-),score=49.32 gnl/TRDRNA2_/TRDRNA2_147219_c1_seq2:36-998(-)
MEAAPSAAAAGPPGRALQRMDGATRQVDHIPRNAANFEMRRNQSREANRSRGFLDLEASRETDRQLVRETMSLQRWENWLVIVLQCIFLSCFCDYVWSVWLLVKVVLFSINGRCQSEQMLRCWVLVEVCRKLVFFCDCMPAWNVYAERLPSCCKPVPLGTLVAGVWLVVGIHILDFTVPCESPLLEDAVTDYIISLLSLGVVVLPFVIMVTEILPSFGVDLAPIWSMDTAAPVGTVRRMRLVPYVEENFRKEDGTMEECCICTEEFDADQPIRQTPCQHLFHEECLQKWVEGHRRSCPLCRANILEQLDADATASSDPML